MRIAAFPLLFLSLSVPALAHHPGERLDEVMADKEPAFEATDIREMPGLSWADDHGTTSSLDDLAEKIVILSFVPRDCGASCAEQQAILASVQMQVNITPMKQIVTFLSVRDPSVSVDAVWDDGNGRSVSPSDGSAESIADGFAALSGRPHDLPIVHVVDRGGRHAGMFHGTEFRLTNLILYINGLTNAPHDTGRSKAGTWWDDVKVWFK